MNDPALGKPPGTGPIAEPASPEISYPSPPASPLVDADQEVDVWWGSYSGWTMIPSFLVCIVLTGLIGLAAWIFVEKSLLQLTILGVGGSLWLGQITRWSIRFFGFNYRLTTRRLFRDKGYLSPDRAQVELTEIAEVKVQRGRFDKLAGVGQVGIFLTDPSRPSLVLEGVRQPQAVADLIRARIKKAQEKDKGKRSALSGQLSANY